MELLRKKYEERRRILLGLCDRLERFLNESINYPRIDGISCRVKTTQSFLDKASKLDDDGGLKYKCPLKEIQDQIGARIITFYKSDVKNLSQSVNSMFRHIERKQHVPELRDQFGYEGLHFILLFPNELIPREFEGLMPLFFELQIKTLFQHAWSEAEHDLGYKGRKLSEENQRKLAFTAAQAWGADHIFDELFMASDSVEVHDKKPSA